MVRYVLDASAAIAFFEAEEGYLIIQDLLWNRKLDISIHSLNMCEVFYHFLRKRDTKAANRILNDMLTLGIDIHDEIDPKLWKKAAGLKTSYRPLSLADAVGVAHATITRSVFVTGDNKELTPLAKDGVCRFLFFR